MKSEEEAKKFWDQERFREKEYGYNSDGSVAWVRYPAVGEAIQNDAVIREDVRQQMLKYRNTTEHPV